MRYRPDVFFLHRTRPFFTPAGLPTMGWMGAQGGQKNLDIAMAELARMGSGPSAPSQSWSPLRVGSGLASVREASRRK